MPIINRRKFIYSTAHAKDGMYPTNPYELGREVPIPEGQVDFPGIISFLKRINFKGSITIECELAEHKNDYILKTKNYLENLILNLTLTHEEI